jgi:inner membrane protein
LRTEIFRHAAHVNWVTQLVLGAALGELLMGRQLGKRGLAWGALIGVMPELNALLHPLLTHSQAIALHHGPSHSLLFLAIASFAIPRGLTKLWTREKVTLTQATCWVATLLGAHLAADCASSRGTAIFWPFSTKSISFNHLLETNILITSILGITVAYLVFLPVLNPKKTRGKKLAPPSPRRRICLWGLGLCTGLVLLCAGMQALASAGFQADLERRGMLGLRRTASPTPHNIFLWRALVDRGDEIWVGYRSVFERRETPVQWTIYPRQAAALSPVASRSETKTLLAITDGWWIARPHVKGAWLGDLRRAEIREWGVKAGMVDHRPAASWLIIADPPTPEALRPAASRPSLSSDVLKRLAARTIGRRDRWNTPPRLAGISGSLPEFLAVQE